MLRDRAMAGRRLNQLLQRHGLADGAKGYKPYRINKISARTARRADLIAELTHLASRLEQSAAEREQRFLRRPRLHYPPALPITAKRHEIVRAIRRHPVVIISGETGCGKSTQIPKMCLEAGRGIAGKIGCTQPRRIAAITIAHRIAEELGRDRSAGRSATRSASRTGRPARATSRS